MFQPWYNVYQVLHFATQCFDSATCIGLLAFLAFLGWMMVTRGI